jgi:tRNA threonylcarbamoyladenosine biosynthesis protein TsaB
LDKTVNLLLINSNDKNAFAALYLNGELIISYASEFIDNMQNKKPDKLINCVHKISSKNDLTSIDAIAVTQGPGSFTGIRVGLSIAKGLAFGLNKMIIPINNFDLTFHRIGTFQTGRKYCILIPSKLPEYYFSVIKDEVQLQSGCIEMGKLSGMIEKDTIIVSDFDDETSIKHSYFEYINVKNGISELDAMVSLSSKKLQNKGVFKAEDIEPVYMKDFIIKTK